MLDAMRGSLEASRDELRHIAEEQSALRRVATLVARGVPPSEILQAVAAEMGHLLAIDFTAINRFEPDGTMTVIANWSSPALGEPVPGVGSRWPLEGTLGEPVMRTGRPARMRTDQPGAGEVATWARKRGVKSAVGCPIIVEGRIWGIMVSLSLTCEQQPEETEQRTAEFIQLVGTAIANAQTRAELAESHARTVTVSDDTRRRIERNLHDGAQQRLVSLALDLRTMEQDLPPDQVDFKRRLATTAQGLVSVIEDLQEIARGLHPAALSKNGLGAALKTLARRSAIPVDLEVRNDRRLDEAVEAAVYYIVAEALTNAAKHANASEVRVELTIEDDIVHLLVRDDGVGGAAPERGTGLTGLRERASALGGTTRISSPPGDGTTILVRIPNANDRPYR